MNVRADATPGPGTMSRTAIDYLALIGVLLAMVVAFSLLSPRFCSQETFWTTTNQSADTAIVAVGMTFVLLIAGIDLSVGSVLALGQAVLGVGLVAWGWPLPAALLACVATGVLCGLVNGLVTVRWALPSFIVTLGMLEVARGATYLITDSKTQYIGSALQFLARPIPGLSALPLLSGVQWPFLIALALVAAGQFVLSRTVFGRYVVAIGTNEEAVRLSGIDPRPVKVAVFALCGLFSALAGMIQVSRAYSANPNAGQGFELDVIAAVVIGGTSLMGGRGSVAKSFLGVLIVAVLGAGLVQVGAQEHTKRLITGAVIVGAVILDYYRTRLPHRSR